MPELTTSEEPAMSSASAERTSALASRYFSAGMNSPKKTTSGLRCPPHTVQSGTTKASTSVTIASPSGAISTAPSVWSHGFAASMRVATLSRAKTWPHTRHTTRSIAPCSSTTLRLPACLWRPSTFCVTTPLTAPAASSSASAAWPALGEAAAKRW